MFLLCEAFYHQLCGCLGRREGSSSFPPLAPPPPLFLLSWCSLGLFVLFLPSNIVFSFFFFSQHLAVYCSIARGYLPPSQSSTAPLASHCSPSTLQLGSAMVHRWFFFKTRYTFFQPTQVIPQLSTVLISRWCEF